MIRPLVTIRSTGECLARVLSEQQARIVERAVVASPYSRLLGEVRHQAGLPLTSSDPATGLSVGLHLDNWDARSVAGRGTSSIRFAMNLGPGSRGLWVGPALKDFDFPNDAVPTTALVEERHLTLAESMLIPVPAGCGYLARTEEFLHDGSTLLAEDFSILRTWLVPPEAGDLYKELDIILHAVV